MSALGVSSIIFACVFGSAMIAMLVRTWLPADHLSPESRNIVNLGTGLIATMAALVLSLLISSAKSSFDRMSDELIENAARAIQVDRALAAYGPETRELRD